MQGQGPQGPQGPQEARAAQSAEQVLEAVLRAQGLVGTQEKEIGLKQAMREELRNQLKVLQEQREEVSDALQSPMVGGADRAGLSRRIENLDGRIAQIDAQIARLDAEIAQTGALGQLTTEPTPFEEPPREVILGGLFIVCVLLPIAIAYARRIWRRSSAAVAAFPQDVADRLARLDRNLDTVALEVERIGEGQRFLTRAFAEQQRGIPAGAAEPVEVPAKEKDWQRKG